MKIGYWNGYSAGMMHGRDLASNDLERALAVLQEQLIDVRAEAERQAHRADAAVDLLMGHLGSRAISLAGQDLEDRRTDSARTFARKLSEDPLEDRPPGPGTTYQSDEDPDYILAREPDDEVVTSG